MSISEKCYSEYDRFAWFYNKYWATPLYVGQALIILKKLLFPNLPKHGRVLDLCCGTGQLADAMTGLGFQVTGIDGSEEMLHFACRNAAKADFIHADARSFELKDEFNGIISTYNSLNHIMSLEELTTSFKNVYSALKDGGVFLFDMNLEEGYRARWQDKQLTFVEEDNVLISHASYDSQEKIGRIDNTMFRLEEGAWRRSDLAFFQRGYAEDEICNALSAAGFSKVSMYDAQTDLGLDNNIGRMYFLARKGYF